jgi:hypothetical protein
MVCTKTQMKLCDDNCDTCFNRSFASSDKVQYWSYKNDKEPRKVFKSTHVKYIFECECGHEFESVLSSISNGTWCPYCANQKLCDDDCKQCYEKSFACSDKVQYWSYKNDKEPREVFKSSGKKYIFECECGHEFESSLDNITKGKWCPYCANQKICDDDCKQCYEKSFASSDKVQYWSYKNDKEPREVFKSANKKYIFECECGHEFISKLCHITNGNNWCPYCAKIPSKLCDDDCKQCYEKSFASSDKAQYWSYKNDKEPRDVFKSSNKKYIFECDCGHEFESQLNSISNGNWCPYCTNQKICDDDKCKQCYDKSFACHNKAQYWSDKNDKEPREVFKSSGKKYIFECECGHEFKSLLRDITNGTWCPYCSNPSKELCDDDDCKQCFNKSFASSTKAQYWSDKNELQPIEVFKSSHVKYIFDCNKCGHEFESQLNNITNGKWCQKCTNKTEGKIFDYLHLNYDNVKFQPKFDWCKNINTNCRLPYDILITLTDINGVSQPIQILLEVDGKQHFELVPHFHRNGEEDFKKGRITDNFKMKKALENNMFIIRICQRYAYNNNNNWQESLDEAIKLINSENLIKYIESDTTNNYDNFYNILVDI